MEGVVEAQLGGPVTARTAQIKAQLRRADGPEPSLRVLEGGDSLCETEDDCANEGPEVRLRVPDAYLSQNRHQHGEHHRWNRVDEPVFKYQLKRNRRPSHIRKRCPSSGVRSIREARDRRPSMSGCQALLLGRQSHQEIIPIAVEVDILDVQKVHLAWDAQPFGEVGPRPVSVPGYELLDVGAGLRLHD